MVVNFGFLLQEPEEISDFAGKLDGLFDDNFVLSYFMKAYDNYYDKYNSSYSIELTMESNFERKLNELYDIYSNTSMPPVVINISVKETNEKNVLYLDLSVIRSDDDRFNGNINEFASYVLNNSNMYYSNDNNVLQLYEIYKFDDELNRYFHSNIDDATRQFISSKFTCSMPNTLDLQRLLIVLISDFGSSVLVKFDKLFYEVIPVINQKYDINEKNVYIEAFEEKDETDDSVSIDEISKAALKYIRKKLEPRFSTADIDSNLISNLYDIYVNKG